MKSKPEIREVIATRRKALNPHWQENASREVADRFQNLEVFQSAETIALYMSIGGEVSLESLFTECWQQGKRTCIPVFNADTQRYEMAELAADTPCNTGRFGIREPISPALIPLNEIDLMTVPGVAFDRRGNRLGRGGGYYDRLLEGFQGRTVGIAFDFQILPEIPTSNHDQAVEWIVTESKIFNL